MDLLSSRHDRTGQPSAGGRQADAGDVRIINDAGSLERAQELGLLRPLPRPEVERVILSQYRAPDNSWVGWSGRFWIAVYHTTRVKIRASPSILDFAAPRWKGKSATPDSGSACLQAGVSVIKTVYGNDRTRQFLHGRKANAGTLVPQKSSQIVEAVAQRRGRHVMNRPDDVHIVPAQNSIARIRSRQIRGSDNFYAIELPTGQTQTWQRSLDTRLSGRHTR